MTKRVRYTPIHIRVPDAAAVQFVAGDVVVQPHWRDPLSEREVVTRLLPQLRQLHPATFKFYLIFATRDEAPCFAAAGFTTRPAVVHAATKKEISR